MIFLRPAALLLLLVPLVVYALLRQKSSVFSPWRKYVDSAFMKYLAVLPQAGAVSKISRWWWMLVWVLLSVAIAGPAYQKLPANGISESPPTVLVVDLNALNAEKSGILHLKLRELLEQLKGDSVGLVLYDTKGYVAAPLTQDTDLIESLVPSLQSRVMPDWGNNLNKGIEKAVELLSNTHYKNGRILILTGGTPNIAGVKELLQGKAFSVGVLGIGADLGQTPVLTRDGAFMRDYQGNLIMEEPRESVLGQLGKYQKTTPGTEDVSALLSQTKPLATGAFNTANSTKESFFKPDVWQDEGVYLALIALPFAALLFRKGVFFVWIVLLSGFICLPSYAGLWLRPDQERHKALTEANELYKAQNYEEALAKYEANPTLESLYNKANTLAFMQNYNEAIAAYDEVLKQNPSHEDALFNKKYLEEQLKQNESSGSGQDNDSQENAQSDSQDNNQSQQDEQTSDNQNNSDSTDSAENQQNAQSDSQDDSQDNSQPRQEEQNSSAQEQNESGNSDNDDSAQQNQTQGDNEQMNEPDSQESTTDEQTQTETNPSDSDSTDSASDSQDNDATAANEQPQEEGTPSDEGDSGGEAYEEVDLTSDALDQETQQILNRLKKDESRVLRYRLYRQYMNQ